MIPWAITIALIIGILTGILLTLTLIARKRSGDYRKWVEDWEQVEWTQAAYRNGIKDSKLAGEEFMIRIHFAWHGIAARHVLGLVESEIRRRIGHDGVIKVEVLRRKGIL